MPHGTQQEGGGFDVATLRELLAQKEAIERQIEQTKKHERSEAVDKVRALMAEYGLTLADLGAKSTAKGKSSRATGKVPAKYRNASTGESWSGRGLQPRWLKAALASGRKISDFAV
ncbi:MAG TPA: H-NS histone family protein [Caldimonas sp.]|nr:H-NS histone family protein [Caldimonas sp.]